MEDSRQFYKASFNERLSYLVENGKCLHCREHGEFMFALYSLHNFFVEVIHEREKVFSLGKVISIEVLQLTPETEFRYCETLWAKEVVK